MNIKINPYAVGDKVFYTGRSNNLEHDKVYVVERTPGQFVFVNGVRYKNTSFKPCIVKVVEDDLMTLLQSEVEKFFKNKNKNTYVEKVCSYALKFEDGKIRYQVNDICHARLKYGENYREDEDAKLKAVALNISHYSEIAPDRELYSRFVDYMLNESPWKRAFIPVPLDKAIASGVYLDIDMPYSYCVTAAIALRYGNEYSDMLPHWKRIIDAGFSSNVAFVIVNMMNRTCELSHYCEPHQPINPASRDLNQFSRFMNDGVVFGSKATYAESRNACFGVFNSTGVGGRDNNILAKIYEECKDIVIKKDNWGRVSKTINCSVGDNMLKVAAAVSKYIN